MSYHVFDGSSWREMQKGYVSNGTTTWRPIQQLWVYDGGAWRQSFVRTPGQVTTVNYSIPATINTGSSVTGTLSWSAPAGDDAGLWQIARFYSRYSELASYNMVSEQIIASGTTSATYGFSLSSNQTLSSYGSVAILNGFSFVNGVAGAANFYLTPATTTYFVAGSPTISEPVVSFNFTTNVVQVSWTFTNAPTGATFLVEWKDDNLNNPGFGLWNTRPSTSTSPVNIGAAAHGYDLLDTQAGGSVYTSFTVQVTMRDSGGTPLVTSLEGFNSCYTVEV